MKSKEFKIALLLGLAYFILAAITLPHYGINWDTINHLPRGQAYLHYFLTGKKDYSDLAPFKLYWQKADTLKIDTNLPAEEVPTRSMYQEESNDFTYFLERDGGGHPPLSDILSSLFNRVFFAKLRLINDIDAYRLYGVFLTAALVGLIFYWVSGAYGIFAGLVSSLSLALYPLFWAESHFNTEKDVPETVYWSFFLFSFWKGISSKSWKWLVATGVFGGLALGTKFNILFSVFVILPWLVVYFWDKRNRKDLKEFISKRKLFLSLVSIPFISLVIFIGTWPYLWPDIISRLKTVFGFYKTIGTTVIAEGRFIGPFGINFYPLHWIVYTTPPIILLLFVLGVAYCLTRITKEKNKVLLLFMLWAAVPIIRTSWPGTTIYGGVRQLMEYIPAMAVVAGIGGCWVFTFLTKKIHKVVAFLILISPFAFLGLTLYKIHPNENVYFNFLIGGLSGAKEKDLPSWGMTYGAAYRQGVNWINRNADKEGRVAYAFELIPNFPRIWLRDDLTLFNTYRSGYLQKGEYVITLISQGVEQRSYFDMFLNKFVEPLYETKVDGVSILKVWKNNPEFLKEPIKEEVTSKLKLILEQDGVVIDLIEPKRIWRLEAGYSEEACKPLSYAYIQVSEDGITWTRLPGNLPDDWGIPMLNVQPYDGELLVPFVGQNVRYIGIKLAPEDACLRKIKTAKVYFLE